MPMGKMMNLDQVQNEINRQNELTLSITFSKNDLEQLWGICLSQSHWNKFVEKKQDQFRSQMTNEMEESEEYYMLDDDDDSDDDDDDICGETGREFDLKNPVIGCGKKITDDDENIMIGNISFCGKCGTSPAAELEMAREDDDDIHICGQTGREYDPNPGMEQGCGVRCDDENGMIGNISYCVPCMEKYEPTGEMPTIFMDTTAVDAPKPKKKIIIKKNQLEN